MGAVLVSVIGNAPAKERLEHGDYITTGFQAPDPSPNTIPEGLITRDFLHSVLKKMISACLSSGLNSLKRLAG
jgi:hypothetical protein